MTGYESKRAAAQDKLDDDDTQVYQDHDDALTIAYQSGYYDGKKAAQPAQEPWRESASDYERGVIDGRQMQAQSSVDKAVNAMTQPTYYIPSKDQRPWVGLTDEEVLQIRENLQVVEGISLLENLTKAIETKLKEKNNAA